MDYGHKDEKIFSHFLKHLDHTILTIDRSEDKKVGELRGDIPPNS
jgi:hypothetical protein